MHVTRVIRSERMSADCDSYRLSNGITKERNLMRATAIACMKCVPICMLLHGYVFIQADQFHEKH